jgi:hypothetical protein
MTVFPENDMIEALILQLCPTLKHFGEAWEPVLRPETPRDRKTAAAFRTVRGEKAAGRSSRLYQAANVSYRGITISSD